MFNRLGKVDGYSYYLNNDSDDDCLRGSDSSEEEQLDEVNVFLRGTPEQQRRALKRLTGDEASSSEDEFEKTMKQELNKTMEMHEKSWMRAGHGSGVAGESKDDQPHTSKSTDTYDDIYFDSDEDYEDANVKAKKKKLTNDELFYDPLSDERDHKWAQRQKLRGSFQSKSKEGSPVSKDSDQAGNNTVLTCPACLTTVCMDCQRHDLYHDQYRAMFVLNCKVQNDEILRYQEPKKKVFKRHRKKASQSTAAEVGFTQATDTAESAEDKYHPVKCDTCNTEVAVYDKEEVYHFFNVLAGPG